MEKEVLKARTEGVYEILKKNTPLNCAVPTLIAVTKTIKTEDILPLADFGITDIGENRTQEILEKAPDLSEKFRIHMIGRLQSNKVKYIIDSVYMIHSVDRLSLAREISTQSGRKQKVMPVLIQVNVAGEKQKGGLDLNQVEDFLSEIKNYGGISVQGLMAMMPISDYSEELRIYFRSMSQLFNQLKEKEIPNVKMNHLSMGMSRDYPIAAQEGTTMVRVGSALFK